MSRKAVVKIGRAFILKGPTSSFRTGSPFPETNKLATKHLQLLIPCAHRHRILHKNKSIYKLFF